MLRFIRSLIRDVRGNLSVELAIAAPVLMGLLLCGIEITRFVLINQKAERTSATIADLVSQSHGMSEGEINSLMDASNFVMAPYNIADDGQIVVS